MSPALPPSMDNLLLSIVVTSNIVSAAAIFAMAQIVTKGAGIHCHLAALHLFQRISLWWVGIALVNNAMSLYRTWEPPTTSALVVYVGFMLACVAGFMRHRLAPPIPSDASWKNPALAARYPRD